MKLLGDRHRIQHDFLTLGKDSQDFVRKWGYPSRTHSEDGGSNDLQVNWVAVGGFGSASFQKGRTYDIWDYDSKGAVLVFNRGHLIGCWSAGDGAIK